MIFYLSKLMEVGAQIVHFQNATLHVATDTKKKYCNVTIPNQSMVEKSVLATQFSRMQSLYKTITIG